MNTKEHTSEMIQKVNQSRKSLTKEKTLFNPTVYVSSKSNFGWLCLWMFGAPVTSSLYLAEENMQLMLGFPGEQTIASFQLN